MPSDLFADVVGTVDELRTLYREPSGLVRAKKVDRLDPSAVAFVEASPFCLLATADTDGRCDVSPRGGPAGFAKVLSPHRLALPDLNGNNLLDSLTNIVANPHVGLLFVRPGQDETLRVEGRAVLTTEPALLASWDGELRRPKLAIGVEVERAYIHCAKSFRRGRVWDPASWSTDGADACAILVENLGLDTATAAALRDGREGSYAADLARDLPDPTGGHETDPSVGMLHTGRRLGGRGQRQANTGCS